MVSNIIYVVFDDIRSAPMIGYASNVDIIP
jgi:hypothetical protein